MPEQGALMEFIRGAVTMSGANTFTEVEVATPASRSEKLAMLIWRIAWFPNNPVHIDGSEVSLRMQLARDTQAAILAAEDDDLVSNIQVVSRMGTAQGSLSEYASVFVRGALLEYFQPPLLYAKQSIFLGVDTVSDNTARSGAFVLGYTLERVPAELFIASLVE